MPRYLLPSRQGLLAVLAFVWACVLPSQLGYHIWPQWAFLQGMRIDYLSPTIYLIDLVSWTMIVLAYMTHHRAILRVVMHYRIIVLVLGVMIYLNVLFSTIPMLSMWRFFQLGGVAGAAYIALKHSRIFLMGVIMTTIIQSILVISQLSNHGAVQGIWYWLGERAIYPWMPDLAKVSFGGQEILRPYGTFSHPNTLGGFFAVLHFIILGKQNLLWDDTKPTSHMRFLIKGVTILSIILSGILVLLSFSKTAVLVTILLHTYLVWKDPAYRWCRLCLFARPLTLTAVSLIVFMARGDTFSLLKRIALLGRAEEIILSYPVWGVGYGTFVVHASDLLVRYIPLLQPVHMIYALFVAEMGIVGVVSLLWILHTVKLRWRSHVDVMSLAVVLLTGLTDHYWLTQPQTIALFAVAIALLIMPLGQNDDKILL